MSVRSLVSTGILPALLFAAPTCAQAPSSQPNLPNATDGPCQGCSNNDGMRLQRAWASGASTLEQKQKIIEIAQSHIANGAVAWDAAAKEYFAWREHQAYASVPTYDTTKQPKPTRSKQPANVWEGVADDYGPEPSDVLPTIRMAAMGYLKDPDSAQFQIQNLFKGYCRNGWLRGNKVAWKGWAANVLINAKNSYGGYTGYAPATVLIDNGKAIRIVEGANFGAYGPSKGLLGGGAGVCQIVP